MDLMPEVFDGESLGKALADVCSGNEKILIPRAKIGGNRDHRGAGEKSRAFHLMICPPMTLSMKNRKMIDEKKEFESGEIQLRGIHQRIHGKRICGGVKGLDFSKVTAACIGKQTKAAADALGMKTYMAKQATIDSVVDLVVDLKNSK